MQARDRLAVPGLHLSASRPSPTPAVFSASTSRLQPAKAKAALGGRGPHRRHGSKRRGSHGPGVAIYQRAKKIRGRRRDRLRERERDRVPLVGARLAAAARAGAGMIYRRAGAGQSPQRPTAYQGTARRPAPTCTQTVSPRCKDSQRSGWTWIQFAPAGEASGSTLT